MSYETYHWLKDHGICTNCGKENALPGEIYCLSCKMDNRERCKGSYAKLSEDKKQAHREKANAYRQQCRKNGICYYCGKRPVQEGRVFCSICLAKRRKQEEKRRREADVLPRFMRGKGEYCYFCGKPGCNGEKVCPECKQRCADQMLKIRGTPNQTHPWRKEQSADVARIKYYSDKKEGEENDR